jgi:putative aldouronate transport system permease protein
VTVNVFNLVVVRGFFQALPAELYDSARLDGAAEWQTLVRVVVPLSKAVIAVVGLFYAVAYWNSFFTAFLYLNDASKWPLSAVLRLFVTQGAQLGGANASESASYQAPQTVQMAVVVLATVPILCVYPFLQRFFTKGVLTGAVKA